MTPPRKGIAALAASFGIRAENFLQHGRDDLLELDRVLRRREMTAAEDDTLRILHLFGGALGHFGGAGEIVFAGQEVDRHLPGNFLALIPEIRVDTVEIQIALEDAGAALRVIPPGLPAVFVGRLRRHEPEHRGSDHFAAMDVGMMQRIDPPARGVVAGFEGDEGGEFVLITQRQRQADVAAHGLAHEDGLAQVERAAERHDELAVELGGELIFVLHQVEVRRRDRLAMPGHVERDDAEIAADVGVAQLVPVLAAVGAGGVQADHRDALAVFLVVGAVRLAFALDINVTPDDGIVCIHDNSPALPLNLSHQREHTRQRPQILPEGERIALDDQLLVQRMRHRPDVVEHRRRDLLGEFRPGGARRLQPEFHAHVVWREALRDLLDLAAPNIHQIFGVVEAQDELARKKASDHWQNAVIVDLSCPSFYPLQIEAAPASISTHMILLIGEFPTRS